MTLSEDPELQEWLDRWREHPDVLGVLNSGSRGAGFWDEHSDYDLLIVASGDVDPETYDDVPQPKGKVWDNWVMSLADLERFADAPDVWTPGIMDSRVLLDKSGEITAVMRRMGTVPPEKVQETTSGTFDGYLNSYYRSMKAARRGNRLGAHLQASESMTFLLRTLFALNGSLLPYYDRLRGHWNKLEHLPCPVEELTVEIEGILQTGDPDRQIGLERRMEAFMRERGYGKVIDEWEGKLDEARDLWLARTPK